MHFFYVDFLDTHSKVYLTCMLINPGFSKTTAPGITFQLKETERILLLFFPLKARAHTFLCTANAQCLAGNTSVYASNKTLPPHPA